ncbi:putative NAD dependent epimerase/dehydratase [Aspergillus heterothallicus]
MSKIIAITGITGMQGGSVANTYLADPTHKADLNDPSTLLPALQNASIIFGVTDFWTIFSDPLSTQNKTPEQDLTEYCFEVEVAQGKNLADAAAQVEGLERFVFSSMASAKKASKGGFDRLWHMESKAVVVEYVNTLEALRGNFSQVQAPIYHNLLWQWGLPTTPRKQPNSSYTIAPIDALSISVPFGDVATDFGKCVRAVANAEPGINLLAVGKMLSWKDYIETWCESQGVGVGEYRSHTIDEYEELLPGGLGREFGENVLFAQDFGYDGNEVGVKRPGDLGIQMIAGSIPVSVVCFFVRLTSELGSGEEDAEDPA